jgi:type I restriction-modification system DNA methylase subunit
MDLNKILSRIWYSIIKQYNFGPLIGGIKDIAQYTAFYVTIINFILIAVTAYNTTLRDWILKELPWFSFPIFIVTLVVLVGIAMILEFKFVYPSIWAFRNKQEYTHTSLLRKDLKEVLDRLEKLEKKIDENSNNPT